MSQHLQLFGRAGKHCAAAYEYKRLLALADHLKGSLDILLTDGISLAFNRCRFLRRIFILCRSHIFGDINEDRTRSSALGDGKRAAHSICQLRDVFYNEIIFGDRHGHTGDINLLEAVAAKQAHANVTGDSYHRDGIHEGGSDAGYQIGSSRTGSSQAYADFSGDSRITVRRMGCALLVGGQDVGDLILVLVKRIIDI